MLADVRKLRVGPLVCRILIWGGLCYWANYIAVTGAGNPTPPADPSSVLHGAAALHGALFMAGATVIPGLLYVFGIRTWAGTVVAGAGFGLVLLGMISSIANDQSSTAGVGFVAVPFVPVVGVLVPLIIELLAGPKPRWLLPPPPRGSDSP